MTPPSHTLPPSTCTSSKNAGRNRSAAAHAMRESIDTLRVRTAGFEGKSVRLGAATETDEGLRIR